MTPILLAVVLVPVSVDAQETGDFISETIQADVEFNPLKTADTSSPRDTLRSFLTDMKIAMHDFIQNQAITSPAGFPAADRATSTLDFSDTPDSDARIVITRQMLMLFEILGRMELPSFEQIPGDAEVARENIRKWRIPGSSLTIERIESGPRAGAFLFSARTVERIPRFY